MDIDFVKDIRRTHCIGCRNNTTIYNNYICDNRAVIDCWLRKTYLPSGVYSEATKSDLVSAMTNNVTEEINQMIINDINGSKKNL
jgi:hypothetical protein